MSPHDERDQELHLKFAKVDLDGNLIVSGTMVHESLDHGSVAMLDATHLRVSRGGERIVRCKAARSESGFMEVEEIGTALGVPAELKIALENAFRFGAVSKRVLALDLQTDGWENKTKYPPQHRFLSWRLSVEERDRAIWVNLSADSFGAEGEPSNRDNDANGRSGRHRVTVTFTVDPITLIACYGRHFPDFLKETRTGSGGAYASSLHALSLGSAPIGLHGACGTFGDHWISYGDHGPSNPELTFARIHPPKRDVTGFLVDHDSYLLPTVHLMGVNTHWIAKRLGGEEPVRLLLGSNTAGYIQGHFSEDNPIERIVEAVVDVTLGLAGLEFNFQVKTKALNPSYREIHGSCLLCWEVLILRYPMFVKHRAKILETSSSAWLHKSVD